MEIRSEQTIPTDYNALHLKQKEPMYFNIIVTNPKRDDAGPLRMGIPENGLYLVLNGPKIILE